MQIVESWLAPYRPYLEPAAFAEAVAGAMPSGGDSQAPDALFRDLLSPIDGYGLATKTLSHLFAESSRTGSVEATPEAVVDFYFPHVATAKQLLAGNVASLAEAYLKLGQIRASEISTAVAYLAGDRSSVVLSLLAGMAVREGRLEEGEAVSKEAADLHPDRPETAYYEALLRLARRDEESGTRLLKALAERHPAYRPAWGLLLDRLLSLGRREAAEIALAATRHHPRVPQLWEGLALAHRQAGEFAGALEAMRQALRLADESIGLSTQEVLGLQLTAALVEEDAGLFDNALRRYRGLLESGQEQPAVFAHAASCLRRAGKRQEAAELLRKGLRLFPGEPQLLSNLGELLFEAGADGEAFQLLQRAAEAEPARTGNILLMASICLRNRRFDTAAELAGAVAKADASRAVEALVLVGDAFRYQGALDAAREVYRAALARAPNLGELRARLEQAQDALGNC